MKKSMFLVASFVLMALHCSAQTSSGSIWSVLGDKAALLSLFMQSSVTATISVDGDENIVSVPGHDRRVTVTAGDGLELTSVVSVTKLGFGFVDSGNRTVWKSCTFWDKNWNVMFQGYTKGEVLPAKGGWKLVWDGDVKMTLPEWINIGLPDGMTEAYAYIRFVDSDGNISYMSLERDWEGNLYFPTDMVGTDAVLVIHGWDSNGDEVGKVVDLSTGQDLPIETFNEYAGPVSIEGVVNMADSLVWVINPDEEDSLLQLTVTEKTTISVNIQTMDGRKPLGLYIRSVGAGKWGEWVYVDGSTKEFVFRAGIYHILMEGLEPLPPGKG